MAILAIHPVAQGALWLALVLTLTAGAFWLMRKLRGGSGQSSQDASMMLTKFRELHTRGGLSDEEFRTIKSKLAGELKAETAELVKPEMASPDAEVSNPADGADSPAEADLATRLGPNGQLGLVGLCGNEQSSSPPASGETMNDSE